MPGATGYITVGLGPKADFAASPTAGLPPLAVAFTDKSTGTSPLTYAWNFGDGGTSTNSNPTHTYSAAGVYTVILTVTNPFGSDTATKSQLVRVGAGPVADFDATPLNGELPLAVAFTDKCAGNPTAWRWDFGDGVTSNDQNPSHTYTRAGTYGVSLTCSNSFGSSTKVKAGLITTGVPPTADFTSSVRTGGVPLTVQFSDASKGNPTSFSWDFGDGGKSTNRNPSHVYTKAGTFTVTLTVSNAYGSDTATKVGYIIAAGKPVADFTADERRGAKPFTVHFTDLSSGNPTSWSWNFGDGTAVSTEQNPTHVYQVEGAYNVTLTVTNSYGSDTITKTGANPSMPVPVATGAVAAVTSAAGAAQGTTAGTGATGAGPQQTLMPGFEGILAVSGLAILAFLAKRH